MFITATSALTENCDGGTILPQALPLRCDKPHILKAVTSLAIICALIVAVIQDFEIANVPVGRVDGKSKLFLIAGPCVIESETHVRNMADAIQRITADLGVPYIFKASYDKANRTSVHSFRGPGLIEGTRILRRLAESTGLPVLTDVHEPGHCEIAAEAVDVLQIPAFLCRQTDLLVAAGKTGRAINVKKGQFVAPWDMKHTVEKVESTGNHRIFLTERGSTFGYNNLVVDMRSLAIMRQLAPVVFDGTHSVQTAVGSQRSLRRPARVHPSARPRRGCGRNRRTLPRGPRRPANAKVRRRKRAPPRSAPAAARDSARDPRRSAIIRNKPLSAAKKGPLR